RGLPLSLSRSYRSSLPADGVLGPGWYLSSLTHLTYSTYLYSAPSTYQYAATITTGAGVSSTYIENSDGTTYVNPANSHDILIKNADGTWDLTPALTKSKMHFDTNGHLA